ncbi:protein RCC2 homolog [Bombus pyrosoma]|uniref:protein RCC2 homolog n=1 Tax=Bombus pyrosoma TaxID=396416 RepID=UPI001CB8C4E4|nr:protein RCC2 homolog [Bombus pyrosoma]
MISNMLKRRLQALGYLEWDKVNINDPQHFRKVTLWLEEQKIRQYSIQDRKELRDIKSESWPKTFAKYCKDVKCPISSNNVDQLVWLIGLAIWLEAENNTEQYSKNVKEMKLKMKQEALVPHLKSTNPLDNLDFESNEFKNGIYSVAKLLRIPQHPNHLVTLKACSKLVQRRLNSECLRNPNSKIIRGKPFPIMNCDPGFQLKKTAVENAAKILALLYIQDIRNLQTRINEVIVRVQSVTANPKTDTKLGKVGDSADMSTKRKNPATKKGRAKSRKVEYDEEDISSEHDSDVDDAETGSNADGEDAAEDDLADVSSIPELPPPEGGWGKPGTLLMCGLTNWDMAGRKAPPKGVKVNVGRSLWTPHTFKNLNGARVRLVASGPAASHSIIVTEDNRCLAFGRNDKGQLGVGDTKRRDEPTEVTALKGHTVIGASCGRNHTLFLTSRGIVFAAGDNKLGQCGVGKSDACIVSATKVKYSGPPIVKVGCGADFSMILDIKGGLHSFGSPEYGALGHNTDGKYFITNTKMAFHFEKVPKRIVLYIERAKDGHVTPLDRVEITDFSCGHYHTVAIDSKNRAFSWGFGGIGRLGHNEQRDELVPRLIKFLEPPTRGVRAIYCGSTYSIAINVHGSALMFGQTKRTGEANMYPKPIQDLSGWEIRCVGCSQTSVVVAADDSVIAWGASPTFGELGFGEMRKSSTTPMEVKALEGLYITAVTCGLSHTLMICRDESEEEKTKINKLQVYTV